MSTGTELAALLTTYLHNDVSFTTANKLTYLNLGLKRIVRDSPLTFRKKEATLSLTAVAGREYSLASDFYVMLAIWHQTTGNKLSPCLTSEFIEGVERLPTIPSGPPLEYTILGFDESVETPAWRIRFDKTPDASYTVTYWYTPMPTAISADVTPGISTMGFDELLLWAAAMIALQPKDPDGHMTAKQNYGENLAAWDSYRAMGPDYTPMLRPASEDYSSKSQFPLGPNFPGG
jgi:hypothetical protein